jgi:hypothetical protein
LDEDFIITLCRLDEGFIIALCCLDEDFIIALCVDEKWALPISHEG